MAPKGEDGSWLRNGTREGKGMDSISVRMANMEAQGSGGESDGDNYGGCFPRGRKVYSDAATLKGAPFARLDAHQDPDRVRGKLLGAMCCCCGQAGYGGGADMKSGGGAKQEATGSGRSWDDGDLSEGCCKAPYWKQLARRAKAHVYVRQAPHPPRGDWLNYDPHSYQMNFDDGCGREEQCASSLYIDENDDPVSRERAMQSALLKKFAASRAQRVGA